MMGKGKFLAWTLFLLCRYSLFYVGAWQLAALAEMYLQWEDKFYFWRGSLPIWDAYALFFWILGLGALLPEIMYVARWLWRRING